MLLMGCESGPLGKIGIISQHRIKYSSHFVPWNEREYSHFFPTTREAKRLRCEHNPDVKAESSCGCFGDDREAKRLRCDHDTEMSR
jgi:hypothetical protein